MVQHMQYNALCVPPRVQVAMCEACASRVKLCRVAKLAQSCEHPSLRFSQLAPTKMHMRFSNEQ